MEKVHDHSARAIVSTFFHITALSTETGHSSGFVYRISTCEVFFDDTLQTLHIIVVQFNQAIL